MGVLRYCTADNSRILDLGAERLAVAWKTWVRYEYLVCKSEGKSSKLYMMTFVVIYFTNAEFNDHNLTNIFIN
jgi:hypothetical protein